MAGDGNPNLLDLIDKIANVDLVYEEYGRLIAAKLSTRVRQIPLDGPRNPKSEAHTMHRIRRIAASFAAVTLIGSAVPAIASATSVITISGATASFPLVQLLAHKYSKLEHNKVSFRISQGGATVGVNDVDAGRVTIADVSRDPLPTDPTGLDFYPIAEYGICVVTNKSNPSPRSTKPRSRRSSRARTRNGARSPAPPPPGRST